jgi:hypothetical protein
VIEPAALLLPTLLHLLLKPPSAAPLLHAQLLTSSLMQFALACFHLLPMHNSEASSLP